MSEEASKEWRSAAIRSIKSAPYEEMTDYELWAISEAIDATKWRRHMAMIKKYAGGKKVEHPNGK